MIFNLRSPQKKMKKIVGILGGMGPEATADFFLKIIKLTPAKKDEEHLHIIIDNDPQIPDRTEAILKGGKSPLPALQKTAQNLERAGADFIVIPCNTAHYFFDEIEKMVNIPLLHMMREVSKEIKEGFPEVKRVGLLSTSATARMRLYQNELEKERIMVISPKEKEQEEIMKAIKLIKGSEYLSSKDILKKIGGKLFLRGAELLVLGCTEIPLILKQNDFSHPVIDAGYVLAKAAVKKALDIS